MKRLILTLSLALFAFISFTNINAYAAEEIKIIVDGEELITDVAPVIINDRTMIPLRAVTEAVGCRVEWFADDRRVEVYMPTEGEPMIMHINDPNVVLNLWSGRTGETSTRTETIDAPPIIVNDRTMVPLRFIAETIGFTVDWDSDTRTVNLLSGAYDAEEIQSRKESGTKQAEQFAAATQEHVDRTYSLDDFEGWWYINKDSKYTYAGDIFYVDAQSETYYVTDMYGNVSETGIAEYLDDRDQMFMECRFLTDDLYMYLDGDNMDDLYAEDSDEEYPVYFRGKAPVIPRLSLDGVIGTWYLNGKTDGADVHALEFFDDGTYCFFDSDGNEEKSGDYELKMGRASVYRADSYDYLFLDLDGEDLSLSSDRQLIGIPYFLDGQYTARGEPMYGGSNLYIHESNIGSNEAYDAVQRFKLCENDLLNEENGSLRFFEGSQVQYYGYNDNGWFPAKTGSWEYADGVLTIVWSGEYVDYQLHNLDTKETEECYVDDVADGFTLPELGRFAFE